MSEKLLHQILDEVKSVNSQLSTLKGQLNENTQMTRIIHDRQEETDAKLKSLTLNVQKLHDEISSIKETVLEIRDDVEFTYQKTSKNELELYKLRKEQAK